MNREPRIESQNPRSLLQRVLAHPATGWIVIAIGIAVRLRRYLQVRGLMHDDAELAGNIFARSFVQLLHPLDMGEQAAPAGFLILREMCYRNFRARERAIRLVPFLAAVLALVVFCLVVRKLAGRAVAALAVGWLALAEPAVHYAAEGKQYSTDLFWTCVVLAMAVWADRPPRCAVVAVVGAVLIWFSHPLLFVLGAVGITWLMQSAVRKNRAGMLAAMAICALWLGSFVVNYLLISRFYAHSDYLTQYWAQRNAFAPVPVSPANLGWYPRALAKLFDDPLGIWPSGNPRARVIVIVGIIIFLAGGWILFRRKPVVFCIAFFSALLAVAASGLHKYPFSERLVLFLLPLLILPLAFAMGVEWGRRPVGLVARLGFLAILFANPIYLQAKYFLHPPVAYDALPGVQYIRDHWRPGDVLYLHWGSDVLGRYYLNDRPELAIPDVRIVRGVYEPDPPQRMARYSQDLSQLQGQARVWMLFSMDPIHDRSIFERILEMRGKQVEPAHEYSGGDVELFDLR